MKIWFEALTGKQSLLMHYLALEFEKHGHEILITSRPTKADRSSSNLDRMQRAHQSIGEYGGATLFGKLQSSASRILELSKIISTTQPDLLISFPSPDAFRTAFGLAIPSIQLNDTPHASAAGKLTISLADIVVIPKAIDIEKFRKLGVSKFIQYEGIDEVLWVKESKPELEVLEKLDVEPYKFVVLRPEESKAEYFQRLFPQVQPGGTVLIEFIRKFQHRFPEIQIIAFPRYQEQEEQFEQLDVIIPEKSVDTMSLLSYAKIAMTGGGTMGREAALLGTPTLYSFPLVLDVSKYIKDLGFPLHHCPENSKVPNQLFELMKVPRMDEATRLKQLNLLKTPFDGVVEGLKELNLKL